MTWHTLLRAEGKKTKKARGSTGWSCCENQQEVKSQVSLLAPFKSHQMHLDLKYNVEVAWRWSRNNAGQTRGNMRHSSQVIWLRLCGIVRRQQKFTDLWVSSVLYRGRWRPPSKKIESRKAKYWFVFL